MATPTARIASLSGALARVGLKASRWRLHLSFAGYRIAFAQPGDSNEIPKRTSRSVEIGRSVRQGQDKSQKGNEGMNKKRRKHTQPLLGIWWDNGQQLVVIAHDSGGLTSCQAGMLDSELTHAEEWPKVATQLGKNWDEEYFIVPRGRVLHEAVSGRAVIYHGPETSRERLGAIAKAFRLDEWISRQDEHYFTGSQIDSVFED